MCVNAVGQCFLMCFYGVLRRACFVCALAWVHVRKCCRTVIFDACVRVLWRAGVHVRGGCCRTVIFDVFLWCTSEGVRVLACVHVRGGCCRTVIFDVFHGVLRRAGGVRSCAGVFALACVCVRGWVLSDSEF